jgi:hypothetical protein
MSDSLDSLDDLLAALISNAARNKGGTLRNTDNPVVRGRLRTPIPNNSRQLRGTGAQMLHAWLSHFWPWRLRQYPGQYNMASHVLGVGNESVSAWLASDGQPKNGWFPHLRAQIAAQHAQVHGERSLQLARELRAYADDLVAQGRVQGKVSGWAVVKERDGPGSIPRDGRNRGRVKPCKKRIPPPKV